MGIANPNGGSKPQGTHTTPSNSFGKYDLLERVSVGGMAEIFRAKTTGISGFERTVAIKRILPSMAEEQDFVSMFVDEAKIAGQLTHENICPIYELGRIGESLYIAMEFVWGKDLLQIINRFRRMRQRMPAPMVAFIASRVCEGLDYAHRKTDREGHPIGLIHRDMSPQNVLVSYEGQVKIIDFGIAKAASRQTHTQAGVLKGKFGYMSPEQVRGMVIDHRSDMFALGTCMHEMVTGERLFLADNDLATLERVRHADARRPSETVPDVPPELDEIVMRALSLEADDRYATAGEMHDVLERFIASQRPPYNASKLAAWMKSAFAVEVAKEKERMGATVAPSAAATAQMPVVSSTLKPLAPLAAPIPTRTEDRGAVTTPRKSIPPRPISRPPPAEEEDDSTLVSGIPMVNWDEAPPSEPPVGPSDTEVFFSVEIDVAPPAIVDDTSPTPAMKRSPNLPSAAWDDEPPTTRIDDPAAFAQAALNHSGEPVRARSSVAPALPQPAKGVVATRSRAVGSPVTGPPAARVEELRVEAATPPPTKTAVAPPNSPSEPASAPPAHNPLVSPPTEPATAPANTNAAPQDLPLAPHVSAVETARLARSTASPVGRRWLLWVVVVFAITIVLGVGAWLGARQWRVRATANVHESSAVPARVTIRRPASLAPPSVSAPPVSNENANTVPTPTTAVVAPASNVAVKPPTPGQPSSSAPAPLSSPAGRPRSSLAAPQPTARHSPTTPEGSTRPLEHAARPTAPSRPVNTARTAALTISAHPDARIVIDGRDTGRTTPVFGLPVAAGTHEVELRGPNGETRRIMVDVTAGESRSIAVRFDPFGQ